MNGRDNWGALVWKRPSDGLEVRWNPNYGLRFYAKFPVEHWEDFLAYDGKRPTRTVFRNRQYDGTWQREEQLQVLLVDNLWRRLFLKPKRAADAFGLKLSRFLELIHRPGDPMGFTAARDLGLELHYGEQRKFTLTPHDIACVRVGLDRLMEGRAA